MDTLTPAVNHNQYKEDWATYVEHLVDKLANWLASHSGHPVVHRGEIKVVGLEHNLEQYTLPSLEATFGEQYVTVEPRAGSNLGRGSLAITAWPSLRRVYLVRDLQSNDPTVYTESRIPLHQNWNATNIHVLVDDLLAEE